ncbi:hypothetical protein GCM10010345_30920 [Streptomyces canarius]|uniref:Uncharacterized protein n=1 Tax=Streptomyces canarius TaxID=285453 RepID=A0ABQ3CKG9_9ACTN|nr:hypothetical protein GCM10010345_30920 [Streptomyces canarius]
MPALILSLAGENAKFLIATALPLTGAACAPLAEGLMGMLMLGIGEAPGVEPAAPPGPVAPDIPAIRC